MNIYKKLHENVFPSDLRKLSCFNSEGLSTSVMGVHKLKSNCGHIHFFVHMLHLSNHLLMYVRS